MIVMLLTRKPTYSVLYKGFHVPKQPNDVKFLRVEIGLD